MTEKKRQKIKRKKSTEQTYNFIGFRKERGIGWEGLSSALLDLLIAPFSFFHSEHIPVLTVHVAIERITDTGQHVDTSQLTNRDYTTLTSALTARITMTQRSG